MIHIDLLEEIYRLWGGKRGYTRKHNNSMLKNHWRIGDNLIGNLEFEAIFKKYILAL